MSASVWVRRSVFVTACAGIVLSAVFLVLDGHVPAGVPDDAPPYSVADLGDALRAVDGRGVVDLAELKRRHARLGTFVAAMAATTPELQPEKFPTVESRIAFWLNAYTALTLLELLDTRSARASTFRHAFDGVAIGGQRLTRAAILRRALGDTGDARVVFAIFTGEKGRAVLDGAPFEGETLGGQLDDAVRRFVRRKENVAIDAQEVRLSKLFERHRAALLAALPSERQHLLQIVWAYLPDACDADRPGCHTRSDLDRACGSQFDGCQVVFVPVDAALAVRN